MINPPIIRVEVPPDVVQAVSRCPPAERNWMPKAVAKFWPGSYDVPICSALPSRIIAWRASVLTAPAKRSRAVFRPTTTGIASTSTIRSSYTSCKIRRA